MGVLAGEKPTLAQAYVGGVVAGAAAAAVVRVPFYSHGVRQIPDVKRDVRVVVCKRRGSDRDAERV
jgi:hypothetical protein